MTAEEFNAEFDIIYENINKNGAPGLDSYEKSVILSHAQENLVKTVIGQEPAADRFPALITVFSSNTPNQNGFNGGYVFTMPTNYLKILNESVEDGSSNLAIVLSISNEQFQVKRSKAYKYPPRRRAWRLPVDESNNESIEIFTEPELTPTIYKCRYVRKPDPIILATLSGGDTIDGNTAQATSELDPGLHRDILRVATALAEQYYMDKHGTDGN